MLIDYVADKRAPTPTGAAEFAVPVKAELQARLHTLHARLLDSGRRNLSERIALVQGLARGIPNLEQILAEATQKFDDRAERLRNAFASLLKTKLSALELCGLKPYYIKTIFDKKHESLNNLVLRLQSVSVESVLRRGFAWVRDEQGKTLYSAAAAQKARLLDIRFADGSCKTSALSSSTPKKTGKNDALQTDLFNM